MHYAGVTGSTRLFLNPAPTFIRRQRQAATSPQDTNKAKGRSKEGVKNI